MTENPTENGTTPDDDGASAPQPAEAPPAAPADTAAQPDSAAQPVEAPPAKRRAATRRAAKLDAVLAAAVDKAREGVLQIAPAEQIGDHVGAAAEGERLVIHRFESRLAGYQGWQWFATLARVPRGKDVTVCEVGLLPSEASLLAPEWVPWAERVRPEEVAAAAAEAEGDAADAEPGAAETDPDAGDVEPDAAVAEPDTGVAPAAAETEQPWADEGGVDVFWTGSPEATA